MAKPKRTSTVVLPLIWI